MKAETGIEAEAVDGAAYCPTWIAQPALLRNPGPPAQGGPTNIGLCIPPSITNSENGDISVLMSLLP